MITVARGPVPRDLSTRDNPGEGQGFPPPYVKRRRFFNDKKILDKNVKIN